MKRSTPPPPPSSAWWPVQTVLLVVIGGLVVITWLTPTEAATNGETVARAIVWMLVAAAWLFTSPHRQQRSAISGAASSAPSPPPSGERELQKTPALALRAMTAAWLADLGVALLIGGHVLSALIVLFTEGQKRFAGNLLAEWLGLGCAWIVLREMVTVPAWRRTVSAMLLAVATAAAALGIWQHQVTLPQMAREYGPKIAAVRDAFAKGQTHPFMRDLAAAGVPTSEPSLTLYEKRLRDSREPFAMFALANTLGGLLASALVWGIAQVAATPRWRSRRWWLGVAALLLMLVCLVFTKSRTASVASVCGLALVGYNVMRSRGWALRRVMIGAAVSAVALVLLAAAAFLVGVWDREVLAEAPKSLGYRWLYWQGTAKLIAERPLFGVGPGQFRTGYLRVKLPEASEEIADPHNLVLEAWVSGGVIAVIGLLICAVSLFRHWGAMFTALGEHVPFVGTPPDPADLALADWAIMAGGAFAFGVLLVTQPWDDALFAMGLAWAIAVAVWIGSATSSRGTTAALLTLGVHLLGAGGMGMPTVVLWGLVLLAMSTRHEPAESNATSHHRRRMLGVIPAVTAGLVALFIWWPDSKCRFLIEIGDRAATRGDFDQASLSYQEAAHHDRWNPLAPARYGEIQCQRRSSTESDLLQNMLHGFSSAAHRDPFNGEWDHQLGQAWRTQANADPAQALAMFRRAWEKYPTNSAWAADWAEAAHAAGQFDEARRAAEIALTQDDINRRLGHVERWLSDARREQLEAWRTE